MQANSKQNITNWVSFDGCIIRIGVYVQVVGDNGKGVQYKIDWLSRLGKNVQVLLPLPYEVKYIDGIHDYSLMSFGLILLDW